MPMLPMELRVNLGDRDIKLTSIKYILRITIATNDCIIENKCDEDRNLPR